MLFLITVLADVGVYKAVNAKVPLLYLPTLTCVNQAPLLLELHLIFIFGGIFNAFIHVIKYVQKSAILIKSDSETTMYSSVKVAPATI